MTTALSKNKINQWKPARVTHVEDDVTVLTEELVKKELTVPNTDTHLRRRFIHPQELRISSRKKDVTVKEVVEATTGVVSPAEPPSDEDSSTTSDCVHSEADVAGSTGSTTSSTGAPATTDDVSPATESDAPSTETSDGCAVPDSPPAAAHTGSYSCSPAASDGESSRCGSPRPAEDPFGSIPFDLKVQIPSKPQQERYKLDDITDTFENRMRQLLSPKSKYERGDSFENLLDSVKNVLQMKSPRSSPLKIGETKPLQLLEEHYTQASFNSVPRMMMDYNMNGFDHYAKTKFLTTKRGTKEFCLCPDCILDELTKMDKFWEKKVSGKRYDAERTAKIKIVWGSVKQRIYFIKQVVNAIKGNREYNTDASYNNVYRTKPVGKQIITSPRSKC